MVYANSNMARLLDWVPEGVLPEKEVPNPLPYLRAKPAIFPTLFVTRPKLDSIPYLGAVSYANSVSD